MKNKLNILIIEDELLIAEMLKELLLELDYTVIDIAKNYLQATTILEKESSINFAILDINLSETKTGLDVAEKINETYKIPFIFLTSYSDVKTIQEALVFKPEAYLIKPFSKTDLYTTLEIVKARQPVSGKFIIIKDGHLTVKLFLAAIQWIKTENVYIEIKTSEKLYLIRNSLDKFMEELDATLFIRIHRSYAVSINSIKAVNGQYVIVNEEKIPLSRKYREELMLRFGSK
jgi:two-component system, LytTR family, response regulator LytT